jgi:glutathione peroxidase
MLGFHLFVIILCIVAFPVWSWKLPSSSQLSKTLAKAITSSVLIGSSLTPSYASLGEGAAPKSAKSIGDVEISYMGNKVAAKSMLGKKATLIVNVASQCALTPQYEGLVSLYDKHHGEGFEILAFPSNQFAGQEPNDVETIRKNMKDEYKVTFPILDKVEVNGPSSAIIYKSMKEAKDIGNKDGLSKISWNFEKFLVDKDGVPVRRYKPGIQPEELEKDISTLISTGVVPIKPKASLNNY